MSKAFPIYLMEYQHFSRLFLSQSQYGFPGQAVIDFVTETIWRGDFCLFDRLKDYITWRNSYVVTEKQVIFFFKFYESLFDLIQLVTSLN